MQSVPIFKADAAEPPSQKHPACLAGTHFLIVHHTSYAQLEMTRDVANTNCVIHHQQLKNLNAVFSDEVGNWISNLRVPAPNRISPINRVLSQRDVSFSTPVLMSYQI